MISIHRLLDQAFAGIPLTPEAADLKEELRTGLVERAAELQASGLPAEQAATTAVTELGDIRALLDDDGDGTGTGTADSAPAAPRPPWAADQELLAAHRVRPRPGFVIGIVVAALLAAGAVLAYTFVAISGSMAFLPLLASVLGLAVGWILSSTLAQETTTNHPMPPGRASGWGLAGTLSVTGVGLGLVAIPTWGDRYAVVWIVGGALLVVLGAVLFTWLGLTQTNRRKAWTRQLSDAAGGADNFASDPALAARFGIYTGTLWLSAAAVAAIVGFTVGWRYSWLTFVAAWAVMLVMLARMNFRPRNADRH